MAFGGHAVGKGSVPYTDATKSAVTDGLTKAASMIGIGHEVFKGLVRVGVKLEPRHVPSDATEQGPEEKPSGGNGNRSTSTSFWELYHQEAKAAGVPLDAAKRLAGRGDWATACEKLRSLIAAA